MKKHHYYVYILYCADRSFYIGVTNNINRRFKEHCDGIHETSYTYSRRPLKLIYVEHYQYILDAIAREKQLKRWSRSKKWALISQCEKGLKIFSKRKRVQELILNSAYQTSRLPATAPRSDTPN